MNDRRRVPYFQRPAPPHDWRWKVSLLGRTLIALGLLMFAFVAYQLWGTGIQTAQAQRDLTSTFEQQLQSTTTATSTTAPSSTDPTATTDTGPTTTATVPIAPPNSVPEGGAVGIIRIPKIDLEYTVVEGVDVPDLQKGPGHFPETPLPGQLGNAAIAGHRTTYDGPFYDLDELQPGDRIEVDTLLGSYVYAVTGSTVVNPSEYARVIPTTDTTKATLTLSTCTPIGTARQRLIVVADLVLDDSSPVLQPPTATVPPSSSTPDTLPGEGDSVPGTDAVDDSTPDTVAAPPTTLFPGTPVVVSDTFAQGWFSDSGAIPWVVFYGLLLVGVTLGAYRIGKWSGRLWMCFVVGLIPFVVVLYFFFENVNRLLPPGL